jgi:hypothetical protein
MNNSFAELTKGLAQSATSRAGLRKLGLCLTRMALACFRLAHEAEAATKYTTNADHPLKDWIALPAALRALALESKKPANALKQVAVKRPAAEVIDFGYYDVEVWLEVFKGEITFDTLSDGKGKGVQLRTNDILWIPRGEVHRIVVAPRGAEYRLYATVEIPKAVTLSPDAVEMLRTNLKFPSQEENTDGHAAEFFQAHLSEALVFCKVSGEVIGKKKFLEKFVKNNRVSSGTVCVLNRTGKGILLSTVVTMSPNGARASFTNVRLFAEEEDGTWKCRMWINYPQMLEADSNSSKGSKS